MTYLFGPAQAAAVAEIPLTTGSSAPFWRIARMAVGTIANYIAHALPPLSLLLT